MVFLWLPIQKKKIIIVTLVHIACLSFIVVKYERYECVWVNSGPFRIHLWWTEWPSIFTNFTQRKWENSHKVQWIAQIPTEKEPLNNTANKKEVTDGQKLRKIEMNFNRGFWGPLENHFDANVSLLMKGFS